jgi:glycosyltransferase involved in cell wall biosynthesis
MEATSLSVLVPVYNEEHLVLHSLKRLTVLESYPQLQRVQIIVVNDGSSDLSGSLIKEFIRGTQSSDSKLEWIYLEHEINQGKGKAIQTALEKATCDISIIHDADLEYHPKDILRMIPVFLEEGADAVYGSRFSAAGFRRVLMFRHELGNKLVTFFCNLASNLNLSDIETCYKAVRTSLLKSIPIESNDFRIEPELTIKLAKRNVKLFEVPINYSGRTYDEGKKIKWFDGFRALFAIVKFSLTDDIFKTDAHGGKILIRLSRARNFNSWLADSIRPYLGTNVIEIGAGFGNLSQKLIPVQSYSATDINILYLEMMQRIKANNPFFKIDFLDINDVSSFVVNNGQFDTLICLNVIEHLEDDLKIMRNISSLLAPGGRAIVLVPQGAWLYGTLDRVLGHVKRYSKEELLNLGEKAGFKCIKLMNFNRVSTIPWFINGRIFRKQTFNRFQIYVLDKIVPFIKNIDELLPWPSTSLIAVFSKE